MHLRGSKKLNKNAVLLLKVELLLTTNLMLPKPKTPFKLRFFIRTKTSSSFGLDDQEEPPLCHKTSRLHKKSFVDDLTLLEKILLSHLIEKERIVGPLNYHDRFNPMLPQEKSILQHQIHELQYFTRQHHMQLKSRKTKCTPFINSTTKGFLPEIRINNEECLEVIY